MKINPAFIHLVESNQFHGLSHENPYNHGNMQYSENYLGI